MALKNKLTNKELELLKQIGIEIENRQYNIEETGNMIEKLDDTIRENLDKEDNFTTKSTEYEVIQDKILEYEKEI